jgi:hypothetical protein
LDCASVTGVTTIEDVPFLIEEAVQGSANIAK